MRLWRSLRRGLTLLRARPLLFAWLLLAVVAAAAMAGVLVRRQATPRAAAASTLSTSAPRLVFEAPPSLSGAASELRWLPAERWQPILDLVGLRDAGAPIKVLLAPEDSPLARRTPRWITGFAVPEEDTVVLLPERVLSYPHDSLAALLYHEVTHVLLARAASSGAVANDGATTSGELPRWFQEGVALLAGRDLAFADRERLLLGGITGVPMSMHALQRAFDGEGYSIDTAYALAGALAEELVREHGRGAVPRIAAEVARGRSFAQAFAAATGEPLQSFEADFWRGFRWRYRWVPFLTSGATLWLAVTALALVAMARRRRRDAAIRRRWDDEERGGGAGLDQEPYESDDDEDEPERERAWRAERIAAGRDDPTAAPLTSSPPAAAAPGAATRGRSAPTSACRHAAQRSGATARDRCRSRPAWR